MPVIEVANLQKRYGDVVAVKDVSFSVEQSEIFGILGPNGAGKTTTVECISGLRRADAGRIKVLGLDPAKDGPELRQVVGAQLQESQLPDRLQAGEALDLYASFYRDPADWRQLADDLGFADKLRTPYAKLSGGQKQRLSIALALVGKPKIAILDELTTGLDPQARRDTWALIEKIRDTGVTIVLVTHFMQEAERLCDRLAVIVGGKVAAIDTPAALVSRVVKEQQLRFRLSAPLDDAVLLAQPDVTTVTRQGDEVRVSGGGGVVQSVLAALANHNITALDLHVEQADLDDAFVELIGRGELTTKES